MSKTKLMLGDNIESLKKLPENSIDSIVSDPPYGLSFMGKKWDYDVPTVEFWKEVYRVLKPGGHVLSFGGTRTYHRMVVNIEDAGFEIRDQVMWLYGSGFPKSHNIGKAVDKIEGNEREVVGREELKERSTKKAEDASNVFMPREYNYTKGQSKYEGWGTALKPANEPICVARKPLSEKTIAENFIKWGTGGINIDGCRVGYKNEEDKEESRNKNRNKQVDREGGLFNKIKNQGDYEPEGRFPANIILDETAAELLDEQSGVSKSKKAKVNNKGSIWNSGNEEDDIRGHNDSGGASRFFYVAKVSKKERNLGLDLLEGKEVIRQGLAGEHNNPIHKNTHPTLKPINLMTYLCRLITPEGGIVLDPFMGSGSTGIAARLEGFKFCGMELDKDYFKIAEARIEAFEEYRPLLKK